MGQKKTAIMISYANLLFGTIVNIVLTPMLIKYLGDVDYSIYRVMQSFAGPLIIFNLGISSVVTRSIVKYHAEEGYSEEEKRNTLALSIMISVIMAMLVTVIGIIVGKFLVPNIYANTYSQSQLIVAQQVFTVFVFSTVVHMLTDAFSGCIVGNEKYAIKAAIPLVKNVLKVILITLLLVHGYGVRFIVSVDLVIAIIAFLFSCNYSIIGLKEIPKLYYIDKKHIFEITSFSLAILLQAFVNQINNNIDLIILGAYIDEKSIITMYSSAMIIYAVYNSLVSVVAEFFLPKATELISMNASGKELTDFVVAPGRFNAVVAVGVVCAFAALGKNFIELWIGEKYIEAYYIALILMIPVTIPLVENVAISILDATLKRIYRSTVLFIMAIVNIVISIVLIREIGFWGAAIGTVISLIIGHGICMNIYYAKVFNMQIGYMFRHIFKGILPAGLLAMIVCIPIIMLLNNTYFTFILECICFCLIYGAFLWKFGMNDSEKISIVSIIKRAR